MVGAFDGWVDAGSAATTALAHLVDDAPVVVTFDADALFDYRARRPTLQIVDGRLAELTWPELAIRRVRVAERDLLDPRRPGARRPLAGVPRRGRRDRPPPRRRRVDQPRRDPGGRAAYPFRADPRDDVRSPAACAATCGPDRPGCCGSRRRRSACSRWRWPRAASRPSAISPRSRTTSRGRIPAASVELLSGPRAAPGRGAPGRRPRRGGATSCATASTPRPRSRRRPGTTSSGSRRMVDEQRLPSGDDLIGEIERFLREGGTEGQPRT